MSGSKCVGVTVSNFVQNFFPLIAAHCSAFLYCNSVLINISVAIFPEFSHMCLYLVCTGFSTILT